jgi:hypothetical protein
MRQLKGVIVMLTELADSMELPHLISNIKIMPKALLSMEILIKYQTERWMIKLIAGGLVTTCLVQKHIRTQGMLVLGAL